LVYIIDEVLHLSGRLITSWWTKGLEENIQIDENIQIQEIVKVPTKTVLVHSRERKLRQRVGKGKISQNLYSMVRNLDYAGVK